MKKINVTNNFIKAWIFRLLDFLIIIGIFMLASFLDNNTIEITAFIYICCLVTFKIVIYQIFGLYKTLVDHIGLSDTIRIAFLVIATNLISMLTSEVIDSVKNIELPYYFFLTLTEIALLTSIRYSRRVFKLYNKGTNLKKTMIIGAGSGGKLVYDEIHNNDKLNNDIKVFLDDDEDKIGRNYLGIPVEGPVEKLSEIIKKHDIEEAIIAIADIDRKKLNELIKLFEYENVKLKRLPLLSETANDANRKIRDVQIEELLGREPVTLDNIGISDFINNKVVLITGAGGSIGSELCRQIFVNKPKMLILFDIYENGVYEIQQDLVRQIRNNHIKGIELITLIGSTYNEFRVEEIFSKYHPDLIFHAAAYKHVPLMEDSPAEAIRTNVLGTYNVAKMADKYKVIKMVLVSTDKAVRPTNVMGATKRFAEMIIQYFDSKSENTSYSAVRFGNVLGSNGSVIPLFKKQIAEGGPVTVTDPNMTRFFMTIPEAVGLILQSGVYATGGEIFILDMGEPVKITTLAENIIRLSGFMPYKDIKIEYIGCRPGEKIFEELLLDISQNTKTANSKIYIEEHQTIVDIEKELAKISKVFELNNNDDIKSVLKGIVCNYKDNYVFNSEH